MRGMMEATCFLIRAVEVVVEERSFGETLAHAREARGLSLQQASLALHIRQDALGAFERGDFASMPHKGHARNMVSAYARYLSLNSIEITNMFLREYHAYETGTSVLSNPSSQQRTRLEPSPSRESSAGERPSTGRTVRSLSNSRHRVAEEREQAFEEEIDELRTVAASHVAPVIRSGTVKARGTGEVLDTRLITSPQPAAQHPLTGEASLAKGVARSGTVFVRNTGEVVSSANEVIPGSIPAYARKESAALANARGASKTSLEALRTTRVGTSIDVPAPTQASSEEHRSNTSDTPSPLPQGRGESRKGPDPSHRPSASSGRRRASTKAQRGGLRGRGAGTAGKQGRGGRPVSKNASGGAADKRMKSSTDGGGRGNTGAKANRVAGVLPRTHAARKASPLLVIIALVVVILLIVGAVALVKKLASPSTTSADSVPTTSGVVSEGAGAGKTTTNILGSMSNSAVESIEKIAGPFTLKVVVAEGQTTWLDINVDGTYEVSGSITGEKTYTFEVKQECEISSGSYDAISVYCNGSQVTLENQNGMGHVALAIETDDGSSTSGGA